MVKQLDLDLSSRKTRKKVGPKLACRMIAILAHNKGWVQRRTFTLFDFTERECRLGRKCSHGRIIFSQLGYRLAKYATAGEIAECCATIQSQIKALQEEHRILTLRAHSQLSRPNE